MYVKIIDLKKNTMNLKGSGGSMGSFGVRKVKGEM